MLTQLQTVINYYGFLHLAYYTGQQFVEKLLKNKEASLRTQKSKGSEKEAGFSLADLESDEELYTWISKWYDRRVNAIGWYSCRTFTSSR